MKLAWNTNTHYELQKVPLSDIQFYIIQELYKLYPEKAIFKNASPDRFGMFDKVSGTNMIRQGFVENYQFKDVKNYWYKDVDEYRKLSSKYYLYR